MRKVKGQILAFLPALKRTTLQELAQGWGILPWSTPRFFCHPLPYASSSYTEPLIRLHASSVDQKNADYVKLTIVTTKILELDFLGLFRMVVNIKEEHYLDHFLS